MRFNIIIHYDNNSRQSMFVTADNEREAITRTFQALEQNNIVIDAGRLNDIVCRVVRK